MVVADSVQFETLRNQINQVIRQPEKSEFIWSPKFHKVLQNAKKWASTKGSDFQHTLSNFFLLMYFDNRVDDDKVITIGEKLLQNQTFMQSQESGYALSALNSSYNRKGLYIKQLAILDKLIRFNNEFENFTAKQTYAYYNQLGLIYYRLENYAIARRNFRTQAKIFLKNGYLFQVSSMFNNIGLTFKHEQQPDSAIKYYKKALILVKEKDAQKSNLSKDYHRHFQNIIQSNIEQIQMTRGEFDNAEFAFKQELASSKAVREFGSAAQAYQKLSYYYYLTEQYDLATIYNDSSLNYEKQFYSPYNRQEALLLKAKILLKRNHNDSVIKYLESAAFIKDSLNEEEKRKNYSEATLKFNFTKSEEALKANRELLAQKEKNSQLLWIITGISIGLMVLMVTMFFKTKKTNIIINRQKQALTKGIKEKEIMFDEIQHRTKNNLQMISGILEIQKNKNVDSDAAASLLQASQEYLQSMFMIHELLYEQEDGLEKLDMHTYFDRMASFLINNYPSLHVDWNVDTRLTLDVKTATPLGLMACELIINSMKHAFEKTGKININFTKTATDYRLTYMDNGKGFSEKENSDSFNTGMNLIFMLAEDLSGEITFPNRSGFCLQLDFKES